jgi:hypothetical protein
VGVGPRAACRPRAPPRCSSGRTAGTRTRSAVRRCFTISPLFVVTRRRAPRRAAPGRGWVGGVMSGRTGRSPGRSPARRSRRGSDDHGCLGRQVEPPGRPRCVARLHAADDRLAYLVAVEQGPCPPQQPAVTVERIGLRPASAGWAQRSYTSALPAALTNAHRTPSQNARRARRRARPSIQMPGSAIQTPPS